MAGYRCTNCGLRKRYDRNPQSFLGRIWRWHATWCPGWKGYMRSLPDAERMALAEKYDLKKFK